MRFIVFWLRRSISRADWGRATKLVSGAVLLVLLIFGCGRIAGNVGDEIMRDPPPRTTLSPSQVREQEQAKEAGKELRALWWDDLIGLTDEQAQLCVDTGWGK